MATMNISLPDALKESVDEQVRSGRYASASDYLRDLIRKDQERVEAIAELQALIDEGLASGVSDKTVDDIRREVREELGLNDASDAA